MVHVIKVKNEQIMQENLIGSVNGFGVDDLNVQDDLIVVNIKGYSPYIDLSWFVIDGVYYSLMYVIVYKDEALINADDLGVVSVDNRTCYPIVESPLFEIWGVDGPFSLANRLEDEFELVEVEL